MPMITDFAEPRDAREVAQTISLFLADHFGWSCSGGVDAAGGELVTEHPEAESVRITIEPWEARYASVAGASIPPAASDLGTESQAAETEAESEASPVAADRFAEPLQRYFAAVAALDELEAEVAAGRISRTWEGLDPLIDRNAAVASDARDVLLDLVRQSHGVAPGERVGRTIGVEVPGAFIVAPAEYGDVIDGAEVVVVPRAAVVRME